MNYEILARKWRPKSLSEVIGQDHIIKVIKNSFILNRIHQSWIFHGTHGVGKTTIARLLAQILNCSNRKEENACHSCLNCKNMQNQCFPDFLEIDGASKTKVEDIKELLETTQYIPVAGKFKIYLIDEIHMLSKHSFNALLKVLEEPPKHVKFILITTEINKIPNTIISRCIFFHLKTISTIDITKHLQHILTLEKINFELPALQIIAEYCRGSIRDALNLIEQMILFSKNNITKQITYNMLGMLDKYQVLNIIISILNKNPTKLMFLLNEIYDKNIELKYIFKKVLTIFHEIILLQNIPELHDKNILSEYKNKIFKISTLTTYTELKNYYNITLRGKEKLYIFPNIKVGLEITLLNLLHAVKNKLFI